MTCPNVNEGAKCMGVLAEPERVDEPIHTSIRAPSETSLAIVQPVASVWSNPSVYQPLENLERTRRQRNWSISVRVRWVAILEDGDNLTELPNLWHHIPT